MSLSEAPKSSKWPFLLADAVLIGAAVWLGWQSAPHWSWREMTAIGGLFAIGSWIFIIPFQRDHEAAVKLWEQANLASAAEQLGSLESIARQIANATGHWQEIQNVSAKTTNTAGDIARQIAAEAKGFSEFIAKANDGEKATLRLEIDKLRRGEHEVLQVILHLMDHCFALYNGALQSGQPQLTQQIGNYRNACMDAVRRIGLVPHEGKPGEPFDPQRHQSADGSEPEPGAKILGTVACGYTFQGTGVRRIVVAVEGSPVSEQPVGSEEEIPASEISPS